MKTLNSDVVVVGAGGAGSFTALRLKQLGFDPILVTKGLVGKSGCSIFAGNLVLSGRMLGTTEEQSRDTLEYFAKYWNNFLIDQHYLAKAGKWIESSSTRNSTRRAFISAATIRATSLRV